MRRVDFDEKPLDFGVQECDYLQSLMSEDHRAFRASAGRDALSNVEVYCMALRTEVIPLTIGANML